MLKTILLLFLFFSAALLFGIYGIPYTVSLTKMLIGEQLMLKIAKGMMFAGIVGFFTAISVFIISAFKFGEE